MAAELFYLPFPVAFSSNGLVAPGAQATFYLTGTSTPAAIYTTAALNVEHTNPVVADASGRLPVIYLDGTVTYRLVLTDQNDVPLGDEVDPYIPGVSSATFTAATGVSVSTRAALANVADPVNLQEARLTEAGEEGVFIFSTDNLSTQVTADPDQKLYVAPSSDPDGSSGAWVRKRMIPDRLTPIATTFVPMGSVILPDDFNDQLGVDIYFNGTEYKFIRDPVDMLDFTRQATGLITFGGQPNDTGTITLNGKVYTFQTVLTAGDGHVLIGASTAASITNLINAITRMDGTPATHFGIATVRHPSLYATQGTGDTIDLALLPNGDSEYIVLSENCTNVTVSVDTNIYYLSYNNGLDASDGSTVALAKKTLDNAITNATSPAIIRVLDDWVGVNCSSNTAKTFSGKLAIIGEGPVTNRTMITSMNELQSSSDFAFAASGANGAYAATFTTQVRAAFDLRFLDEHGIPYPLTNGGSQAAVEAADGENTMYWESNTWYVHMKDGVKPEPGKNLLYCTTTRFEIQQDDDTADGQIIIRRMGFASNGGSANTTGAFRYRSVNAGSENAAQLILDDCIAYGASGNGFQVYDASIQIRRNCHTRWNHTDGMNDHSFVTTGSDGEFITVYEIDCTSYNNGFADWADQGSLSTSANCFTAHDSIHILRMNSKGSTCNGAVYADVNGTVTVNLGCYGADPGPTAGINAIFWHDAFNGAGSNNGMYLRGCSAFDGGDPDVKMMDNTAQGGGLEGQIYVEYWRGQTDGAVKGSLLDWDGNPL